jgi:hydrogenase expression/formation protein HypC
MCVAIPSKIISKDDLLATVEVYGARRQVNLMLLPEEAEVGDYVLVHAGFAIQKVDVEAGKESLKLFDEVLRKMGVDPDNA